MRVSILKPRDTKPLHTSFRTLASWSLASTPSTCKLRHSANVSECLRRRHFSGHPCLEVLPCEWLKRRKPAELAERIPVNIPFSFSFLPMSVPATGALWLVEGPVQRKVIQTLSHRSNFQLALCNGFRGSGILWHFAGHGVVLAGRRTCGCCCHFKRRKAKLHDDASA